MHAEDNDGVELPKVNEDLRNFFLPRKQVVPEPEAATEVRSCWRGSLPTLPCRDPLYAFPPFPLQPSQRLPCTTMRIVRCSALQAEREDVEAAATPTFPDENASCQVGCCLQNADHTANVLLSASYPEAREDSQQSHIMRHE